MRIFVKIVVVVETVLAVLTTVQAVRYLGSHAMYSRMGHELIGKWFDSGSHLPVDVAAGVIGLAASYLLVFRLAGTALRLSHGQYGTRELEKAVLVSSLVLLTTSVAGFAAWMFLVGSLALDWLLIVVGAAFLSFWSYQAFWKGKKLSSTGD